MSRGRAFWLGLISGVAFSVVGYFAVFHEHLAVKASSAARGTPKASGVQVVVIDHELSLDSSQLAGLTRLPLTEFEEKLGLERGWLSTAGEWMEVRDEFMLDDYAACDRIVALPVKGSANHLVVGVLYGHVHVVSLFAPRWEAVTQKDGHE